MMLPETDDSVIIVTTGLSRDDRDCVNRWITALGWTQVDDFTSQGASVLCSTTGNV